jgi:subtilisin family serine protease
MKSMITALALLLLIVNNVMAQSSTIELLVRIKPNVEDYFEKSNIPILENDKYQKLSTVTPFINLKAKNIRKAFAWATKNDTVRVLPNGNLYHLPDYTKLLIITLEKNTNLDSVLRVLKNDKSIMNVEVNGYFRPASFDPLFNKQWNLHNDGSISGGVTGADIHASEAWGISTGSSSVKIGIVGTGIDKTHPDLVGKVLGDDSFTGPHETQVAGIIGAYGNNNIGIAGVDWNSRLISGNPQDNKSTGIIDAIIRVTSAGANIINNSWVYENPLNPLIPDSNIPYEIYYALKASYEAGVVIVNAAPQLYEDIDYPSSFGSWMINVSATGNDGLKTYYALAKNFIDVAAPGGDISVIAERGVYSTCLNAGYTYDQGTSFAAPHVSGTAGLLLAVNPTLKNYDIKAIITRTAKNYPNWEHYLGFGQINAYNALNFVSPPNNVIHGTATFVKDQSNWTLPIFGSPLLGDGIFTVDRYKLSFNVNNLAYVTPPTVLMPVGYPPNNPLYIYDYTGVTSSTSAASGSSYFYYVISTFNGVSINTWIPFNPQKCYTLIGVLQPLTSATISGPSTVNAGSSNTFTVTPTGGQAPYNYQWRIQYPASGGFQASSMNSSSGTLIDGIVHPNAHDPGTTWYSIGVNSSTVSPVSSQNFVLKCDVTDNSQTTITSNLYSVSINGLAKIGSSEALADMASEVNERLIPTSNGILNAYPNPFNPSTTLTYQLTDEANVSMTINDITGKQIADIAHGYKSAGEYSVQWNGKNSNNESVASGMYFVMFKAIPANGKVAIVKTGKLMLTK